VAWETGRDGRRQSGLRSPGELLVSGGILGQQLELGVGQVRQGVERARGGRPGARRGDLGRTVPRHDGARDHVAQALGAGVEGHEEGARQVGRGKKVGGTQQVPGGRRAQGDRVAGIHHHPDADRPLPRRLTLPQTLEENEVAGPGREPTQDQDRAAQTPDGEPVAGEDGENGHHAEERAHQDDHVEDRGERTGADARDLQVEHDVLGRLDLEMLAVVSYRCRRGGHVAQSNRPRGGSHLG
jgi:hypothetical protein